MRKAAILISALALGLILYSGQGRGVLESFASLNPLHLGLALALLLVNLALAFARFVVSFRVLGLSVPTRDLPGPFFVGQVANLFPFGLVGQAAGRSAILARLGVSSSAVTFLSFAERIIALGSLSIFAALGVGLTFGALHLDPASPGEGPTLLATLAGAAGAFAVVVLLARHALFTAFRDLARQVSLGGLGALLLLSLAAHATMLGAFWTVLRAYTDAGALWPTLGALCVVMFASSLPISFAGWGIRELSSVQALSAIGISDKIALATGLTIGALSTVVIVICIAGAVLYGGLKRAKDADLVHAPQDQVSFDEAFVLLLAFAVAVLLPFQIKVPLENSAVVVNMADLFAMAGLAVLAGDRDIWRSLSGAWFLKPLGLISAALALSLVVGLFKHGPTGWALVNRGVGWMVIVSYFAVGQFVLRRARAGGLETVMFASVSAFAFVCVLHIAAWCVFVSAVEIRGSLFAISQAGFAFNSNAYAFLCVYGLAIYLLAMQSYQDWQGRWMRWWVPILLVTSLAVCVSRTGVLLGALVVVCAPLIAPLARKPLLLACLVGAVIRFGAPEIPNLPIRIEAARHALLGWTGQEAPVARHAGSSPQAEGVPAGATPPSGTAETTPGAAASTEAPEPEAAPARSNQVFYRWQTGMTLRDFFLRTYEAERVESVRDGLAMFLRSPVLGGGLGGFLAERAAQGKPALIIHNVPVWILAEMGLVGFGLIGAAFGLFVRGLWQRRAERAARVGFLMLALFAAGGLAHDYFYQRSFWFGFGLVVAALARGDLRRGDRMDAAPESAGRRRSGVLEPA